MPWPDPEQAAIAPSTADTAIPSLRTQDMHFHFLELWGFQHDGREMVLQVSTVSQVTGWMQTCPQPRSQPLSLCHPLFHQTPTHWGGHEIHSVWETCHTSSQELKLCRSNLDYKLDSSAFESIQLWESSASSLTLATTPESVPAMMLTVPWKEVREILQLPAMLYHLSIYLA